MKHTGSYLCREITFEIDAKLLAVPAGSPDSKIYMKPNRHMFYKYKAKWDD